MSDQNPYIRVWVDGKNAYAHRLKAEERLGRPLEPGETVHHEADKHDNEQIKVFASHSEHMRYEHLKRKIDSGMIPLLPIDLLER